MPILTIQLDREDGKGLKKYETGAPRPKTGCPSLAPVLSAGPAQSPRVVQRLVWMGYFTLVVVGRLWGLFEHVKATQGRTGLYPSTLHHTARQHGVDRQAPYGLKCGLGLRRVQESVSLSTSASTEFRVQSLY